MDGSKVLPQSAGWITSYPPNVNGYVMQIIMKIISLKTAAKLFQVMYNLVYNP